MSYLIIDKGDKGRMRERMRDNMRGVYHSGDRRMNISHGDYHDGYRDGYREGWEDAEHDGHERMM